MKFIIFVLDDEGRSGSPDEMVAIDAHNDKLREDGHWVMAAGLAAPADAQVFDNRGGAGIVESGSIQPVEQFYSGFWIVEADDLDTAREIAANGSRACNRKVELRPFL